MTEPVGFGSLLETRLLQKVSLLFVLEFIFPKCIYRRSHFLQQCCGVGCHLVGNRVMVYNIKIEAQLNKGSAQSSLLAFQPYETSLGRRSSKYNCPSDLEPNRLDDRPFHRCIRDGRGHIWLGLNRYEWYIPSSVLLYLLQFRVGQP